MECPELLVDRLTPAQAEGRLCGGGPPRRRLDERRRRLREAAAAAHELTAGAIDAGAEVDALAAERAHLLSEVEELRARLRGRHGVGPDTLDGLDAACDDPAFQKLLAQLLSDARLENEWGLDPDVLKPFRRG